jgi:hypothetical protein
MWTRSSNGLNTIVRLSRVFLHKTRDAKLENIRTAFCLYQNHKRAALLIIRTTSEPRHKSQSSTHGEEVLEESCQVMPLRSFCDKTFKRRKSTWITFKDAVCIVQQTHFVSIVKTNQLSLYREITAVCSENHVTHRNTFCGQNIQFLSVKTGCT